MGCRTSHLRGECSTTELHPGLAMPHEHLTEKNQAWGSLQNGSEKGRCFLYQAWSPEVDPKTHIVKGQNQFLQVVL